jgi:hypothetical protein
MCSQDLASRRGLGTTCKVVINLSKKSLDGDFIVETVQNDQTHISRLFLGPGDHYWQKNKYDENSLKTKGSQNLF